MEKFDFSALHRVLHLFLRRNMPLTHKSSRKEKEIATSLSPDPDVYIISSSSYDLMKSHHYTLRDTAELDFDKL